MKRRVFLDTNIFIYAFEFPESNSGKVIELLNKGQIETVISERVVKEVQAYFKKFHSKFREVVDKLTPYLSLEWDVPVKKEILEGGFMYRVGGKYPVKISDQTIDIDLSLAGHDGIYGYRPEKISAARLTLSTIFKLGQVELTPELNFQKRLGYSYENGGIANNRIYGGLKMVLPFGMF